MTDAPTPKLKSPDDPDLEFHHSDSSSAVSHWFLNSGEIVEAVADTPEWRDEHRMVVRVTVNGVELDFKSFDAFCMGWLEREHRRMAERFKDAEAAAERRAREIIAEKASDLEDRLYDLLGEVQSTQRALERWNDSEYD